MTTATTFDVVIVGGGVMGCSCAYHLRRADDRLRVALVERDPSYARASSALSLGNARIQFSLEQNIRISQYTFEVISRFEEEMAVDDLRPDIGFKQHGNLFLVPETAHAGALEDLEMQRRLGCEVEWWTCEELQRHYPLYEPSGFVGATFGPRDGHLDGYAFLMAYRAKAASLGARLVEGEVVRICHAQGSVTGVELATGATLAAEIVLNCAGAWAAGLAETAGVSVPIEPVQRQVFVVEPAVRLQQPLPLTGLPSGLYFRSEGEDRLVVGRSLPEDRVGFDFAWSEARFNDILWPELAAFAPVFDSLRLERGWTGLYAVNTLDGNAILGEWPELTGLFLANGFSGHGLQQAPAVGRYLSELILDRTPALDLAVFTPERILQRRPLRERALV